MSTEETTDVVDDQEVTSTDSSPETPVEDQPATDEESSEDRSSSENAKTVPYERFAEVNKNKRELEKKIVELEQKAKTSTSSAPSTEEEKIRQELDRYLKDLGYINKQELERIEQDKHLERELESLEGKYSGKDGRPKFNREDVLEYAASHLIGDPEVAYKTMYEKELLDIAIKQATGRTKPTRTETSDGSGSQEVGESQSDLRQAAQNGDRDAFKTLIKRSII